MSPSLGARRARSRRAASDAPHGYFDGVVDGQATGWCWRESHPEERLDVEVVVDGIPVARAKADRRRENVAKAGYGDGRYGFNIALPDRLADGRSHQVGVLAGGVPLPAAATFLRGGVRPASDGGINPAVAKWAQTTFTPDAASQTGEAGADRSRGGRAADAGPATDELAGYLDGVEGNELFGWVVDPVRPEQSLNVTATFDGASLGTAPADISRSDVERAGYGAKHGFRLALPAAPKPGQHTVEVRTEDGRRVPLSLDYVVVDQSGAKVAGVLLLEARGGEAPPTLTTAKQALVGDERWLFEWRPGEFHILRGAETLPMSALRRQHVRLRARRDLARSADAVLIEAVVPAKLSVYRDRLPAGLEVHDEGRPVSRLLAVLRDENGVDLLDLDLPLRQARGHGEVFGRTSRSLTWLGAFAAYRVIAKELAKYRSGVQPLRRGELRFGALEPVLDTLAEVERLAWIGSSTVAAGSVGHDDHEAQPRPDWRRLAAEFTVLPAELATVAGEAAALLHRREPDRGVDALVIHDGSAERIAPFLAEHFDRTLLVGTGAQVHRAIAELSPALIVEVVAERTLLLE